MRFVNALALVAATSQASLKQQITSDGRIALTEQHVGLGADDDLCIFKNGWDQWCFSTITPTLRLGLEWDQKFDQTSRNTAPIYDYWQIEMKAYGEAQAYIDMLFHIEKLISIDTIFDLENFYAALIASLVINEKWQFCLGLGYEHERIYASWRAKFQIYNCTKALIDNVMDFSSNWTGSEALILEDCDFNSGNNIALWNKSLIEDTIDPQIIAGTFNPKSSLCSDGLASTGVDVNSNVKRWIRSSMKTLGDYMLEENNPFRNLPVDIPE